MSETAKLIVTTDKQGQSTIELSDLVTIGRSTSNNVFIDDPDVSRHHAEIRRRGNNYILIDLGSVNGTWLNSRRITVPKDLEDSDQIRIGSGAIRFVGAPDEIQSDGTVGKSTRRLISSGHVVVLVADIRNYTAMSETLPSRELSRLLSDWFKQAPLWPAGLLLQNRMHRIRSVRRWRRHGNYWLAPAHFQTSSALNSRITSFKSV
jgi:adenylate cyclase